MKIFPNLPVSLRIFFTIARVLCVSFGILWLITLTFGPWIKRQFGDEPRLMISVGEISLGIEPAAAGLALKSNSAEAGFLFLASLRGALQMDLVSRDSELRSTLRWALYPAITGFILFAWFGFGSLLRLSGNIARGEVFSDRNLRLVRRVGLILIGYCLVQAGIGFWAVHIMNGYLQAHVTFAGISVPPGYTVAHFNQPLGFISFQGGVVTGGLVLMIAEAFRQGLSLKTENDLTV
jgi:hypothetical protein